MDKITARFARAKQYTGEKLGRAEKTAYDETFETLANKSEAMKSQTDKILKATSAYLQPNPNRRFEANVYARLKRPTRDHINELEALGHSFLEASDAFEDSSYANALQRAGEMEVAVGARFTDLTRDIQTHFVAPLKDFIQTDLKHATSERKVLNTLRLDLDAAKAKLKKAAPEKQQQAESELMAKQNAFDEKYESVKLILEKADQRNEENAGHLLALLKAQQRYFEDAARDLSELTSALESDLDISVPSPPAVRPNPNVAPLPLRPQAPTAKAKALVNREAASAQELTLVADETLTIFPEDMSVPDGWVLAERDGKKGRVPEDCLERL
eukprot:m.179671 g.179671  ORF g.179671 m.179671 type:complete len:329 (-) comp16602_c3_seq1:142-1128(-)